MNDIRSPSRFSRFLDTNYAPSPEERVEIESTLHSPEERLRSLDIEISRLQAEREELRQYIERHRMLLSPFRRLPADLWGEIFVQALPLNERNLPGRTLKDAPLLLTTVCRSWREIALRTPRLWNRIHIYLPRDLRMRNHLLLSILNARKEGVRAWLDRSGSLPITFSIAIGFTAPIPPGARRAESGDGASDRELVIDAIAAFVALLARYSRQWKAISLSQGVNDPMIWQTFADLVPDDLPLLQDVRVDGPLFTQHHTAQTVSATATPLAQMLCKVPLRTLHIKVDNWANVLDLTLKWSTVTDLHITSYEADPSAVITKLVELCPFLTSLSLVLVAGRPHQPQTQYRDHTASLEWKFLRNLDIQLMEDWRHEMGDPISESLSQMLRGLRTPALEHLALDANLNGTTRQSGYTGSTMPFHDMIVLSNSPVRRLELNWFFFSNSEALSRTLESLPSLKSLKLSKSAYGWDEVVERGGNNVPGLSAILLSLCPPAIGCREIEKLELFGCEIGHIDAIISYATAAPNLKDLCVDFGSMRWESTVSLETLSSNNVREALLYLREVKGTRVIWRWPRHFVDRSLHDSPYTGLENSLPRIAYESL